MPYKNWMSGAIFLSWQRKIDSGGVQMENQIESLKDDKLRFDSWIEAAESERSCQDHSVPDY